MNKRFDTLVVEDGVYVPPIGRTYPQDRSDQSLLSPEFIHNINFDEHYRYLDDSWWFKLNNWLGYYFFLYPIVFLLNTIKNGLRFCGRNNLRKWRKELNQNGAIVVCNHCNYMDAASVLQAIHAKHTLRIPMYAPTFNTKLRWYLWAVGGVPIPESGMQAMKEFNEAFDEFNRRKYWFLIFPEAARWDAYKPLRPFQKGSFTMAYKYNKPLLPVSISFRERTGIYRLFGSKDEPLLTVNIGEPVFPDTSAPRKQEVDRLRDVCHDRMAHLAGIVHNTWPADPNLP